MEHNGEVFEFEHEEDKSRHERVHTARLKLPIEDDMGTRT